jgi:hypothetical protein
MRATIASSVLCQLSQVLRETSVPGQANVPAPFQHMYYVVYCTPRRNFLAVKCQLHSSDHLHAGVDAHDHTVHGGTSTRAKHTSCGSSSVVVDIFVRFLPTVEFCLE